MHNFAAMFGVRPRTGFAHAAGRRRRGAMIVFIAMLLTVFFVMVAMSVDIAYMQLARTELRTATDAAARAAVESLTRTAKISDARKAAKNVAKQNTVGGQKFKLANSDIEFGTSRRNTAGQF